MAEGGGGEHTGRRTGREGAGGTTAGSTEGRRGAGEREGREAVAGLVLREHGIRVGLAFGSVGGGNRVDDGLGLFVADFWRGRGRVLAGIVSRAALEGGWL